MLYPCTFKNKLLTSKPKPYSHSPCELPFLKERGWDDAEKSVNQNFYLLFRKVYEQQVHGYSLNVPSDHQRTYGV